MADFKSIIGVRNIHFAKKKEGNTWDAPVRVMGLQEISIKNTYAEGSLLGDMVKLKYKKTKTGLEVSCSVAEYTTSIKAMLEGGEVSKGEFVNSADNMGNDIALLFEQVYDDGSSVYNVIYDVALSADNLIEGKGNSENIEFAVTSLSGQAVAIEIDGKKVFNMELDTSAEDVTADKVTNFFKSVQLPGTQAA